MNLHTSGPRLNGAGIDPCTLISRTRHHYRSPATAPASASHSNPDPSSSSPEQQPTPLTRRTAFSLAAGAALSPALPATAGPFALPSAGAGAASSSGRVSEVTMVMKVTALRGSVPQQWVLDFKTAMEGYGLVALTQRTQLAEIWSDLKGSKATKGKPTNVDCVSLGDSWLQRAITEDLIQPIKDPQEYRWWRALHPRWRQLVTRDSEGLVAQGGEVWGVPYRWGTTLVVYHKDRLARKGVSSINDWDDLLRPELKGRIAFYDSPRDVIAIALKTLGLSANATASDIAACGITEDQVVRRVRQLISQVRVFSNLDHLRALSAGEVDIVVGYSEDLLPVAERSRAMTLVAPVSGTVLWADVWCVPKGAAGGPSDGDPSPLLPSWLDLSLQPSRAAPGRGLRGGASPLLLPSPPSKQKRACDVVKDSHNDKGVPSRAGRSHEIVNGALPSEDILMRSEFLLPVPDEETRSLYRRCLTQK